MADSEYQKSWRQIFTEAGVAFTVFVALAGYVEIRGRYPSLSNINNGIVKVTATDCGGIYCREGVMDSSPSVLTGDAHWYGDDPYLDKNTASGEKFDQNAMKAASWRWPLGTTLRVDRVDKDGNSVGYVVVTVNDRGPNELANKDQNVVIDLTKAAFAKLADVGKGTIKVEISLISLGK